MCIFLAETIFQASNGLGHVNPSKMVPLLFSWHAWAFLTPTILLTTIYLHDGIQIYRAPLRENPTMLARPFSTDLVPLAPLSFSIPLSGSVNPKTGIKIDRAEAVVVDENSEKVPGKDSFS